MFNYLIILTAVINLINSQEPPEVDDVAILSGLASSTLDCSLKFDRDFIASNADIAAAIEDMLENRPTRQPRATKEPCEDGEDCRPRRGGRGGKGRRDTTTVAPESETVPEFRRALRGKGKGRGVTRQPLADGETREPKPTREPCTGDDCERRGKGKGRGVTREPLADGETREPRSTREPCTDDDCERRGGRGKGKGRGRRSREGTKQPCEDGEDCRRRRHDDSESIGDEEATTAAPLLRRALERERARGVTREPLADDETREPRQTREPKDGREQPCEGEDCRRRRRREADSTNKPREDAQQRLLRRGERNAELDGAARDPRQTREQGDRKQRRRRKADDTEESTTEPLLRRSLGRGGRRGRRGIEATISDGSVEVAGLVGEVIFGEVDEDLESVPLSLTLGGVTFSCDVEVRRRGVSCRAISEEDFKVRIGCAIETREL